MFFFNFSFTRRKDLLISDFNNILSMNLFIYYLLIIIILIDHMSESTLLHYKCQQQHNVGLKVIALHHLQQQQHIYPSREIRMNGQINKLAAAAVAVEHFALFFLVSLLCVSGSSVGLSRTYSSTYIGIGYFLYIGTHSSPPQDVVFMGALSSSKSLVQQVISPT